MSENECRALPMHQYVLKVTTSAMNNTLGAVGIKWKSLAFSLLAAAFGLTWKFPAILTSLQEHPSSVIAASIVALAAFMLTGAHAMHIEDHAKWGGILRDLREDLAELKARTDVASPANTSLVKRIMENLAHQGRKIAMGGDSTLYGEWVEESESFVKSALVAEFQESFCSITSANSTDSLIVRDDGTRETGQISNMICTRADWMKEVSAEIEDSKIAYGRTEKELLKWVDWKPSRPTKGNSQPERKFLGTPATPSFVSQIMEHFAFHGIQLGNKLDRSAYSEWHKATTDFVNECLTPAFRYEFETTGANNKADPETSLMFLKTQWLNMWSQKVKQSDIIHGVTAQKLERWKDWRPSSV